MPQLDKNLHTEPHSWAHTMDTEGCLAPACHKCVCVHPAVPSTCPAWHTYHPSWGLTRCLGSPTALHHAALLHLLPISHSQIDTLLAIGYHQASWFFPSWTHTFFLISSLCLHIHNLPLCFHSQKPLHALYKIPWPQQGFQTSVHNCFCRNLTGWILGHSDLRRCREQEGREGCLMNSRCWWSLDGAVNLTGDYRMAIRWGFIAVAKWHKDAL